MSGVVLGARKASHARSLYLTIDIFIYTQSTCTSIGNYKRVDLVLNLIFVCHLLVFFIAAFNELVFINILKFTYKKATY